MNPQKLNIAILVSKSSSASPQTDINLLQIYGESLLQISYFKLKDLFDKVIVVTDSFDKQSIYIRQITDDVLVDTFKRKNELTEVLTAFQACSELNAGTVFLTLTNMPFVNKDVISLLMNSLGNNNAVVPRHANNKIEPFHSFFKAYPALKAMETAHSAGKSTILAALNYLQGINYFPSSEIIKTDPKLECFFTIDSEVTFQRASEKIKGKAFKYRTKKAQILKSDVKIELETDASIYFKVPGSEEEHEVRLNKRTQKWSCDCKHFSVRASFCSHIIAAQGALQ